jgi:UDP-GlcNAc:undecaprenyl-phosphate GlcNAc-1-phosphate transferase
MIPTNGLILLFAISFLGCVIATPAITRLASWLGAIDRPDQYRRIHKGEVPRLGGLAVALGLATAWLLFLLFLQPGPWLDISVWTSRQGAIALAALVVLVVGAVDDTRSLPPRVKLLGQAVAVLILYWGEIRIDKIGVMNWSLELSWSVGVDLLGRHWDIEPFALLATLLWFLGCMNIWNLIDGMDGLAAGVGLLVTGTLLLVALYQENVGSVVLATALAGSLAGFLLYNWHPACIFLGDTGSLLIGLLIGVIGVQDSLKGPSAVSILFPILAMGLPVSDTAMAILRRWIRDLPMTSADRQHVHHLLIGLGLGPRRAAAVLYFFTAGLCGIVLLGVAWNNEILAIILGLSGVLAFLVILTSRRDELARLRDDFGIRLRRGKQERAAARITWETIQRIDLAREPRAIHGLLSDAVARLGARLVSQHSAPPGSSSESAHARDESPLSVVRVGLRYSSGRTQPLELSLELSEPRRLDSDVVVRSVERLARATVDRLAFLDSRAPVNLVEATIQPKSQGTRSESWAVGLLQGSRTPP